MDQGEAIGRAIAAFDHDFNEWILHYRAELHAISPAGTAAMTDLVLGWVTLMGLMAGLSHQEIARRICRMRQGVSEEVGEGSGELRH